MLETEKLMDQLEKKLKIKADQMIVRTIDFQQAYEEFWTDGVETDESA